MSPAGEWGCWAHEEVSRAGELPAWLTADAEILAAVEAFDGSCEAEDDIWHLVKHAIDNGKITPPVEAP